MQYVFSLVTMTTFVTFVSLRVTSGTKKVRAEALTSCFRVGPVGFEPTTQGL